MTNNFLSAARMDAKSEMWFLFWTIGLLTCTKIVLLDDCIYWVSPITDICITVRSMLQLFDFSDTVTGNGFISISGHFRYH